MFAPPTEAEPYARAIVRADADREVLLMTWRPGATCAPHDHGEAGGVVHLVTGGVVERHFAFDGRALAIVSERRLEAPAVMDVPAGLIHDITAIGETTTVHVYSPRVLGMRVYDTARRETLIVADDCGAWVPDEAAILGREAWLPAVHDA